VNGRNELILFEFLAKGVVLLQFDGFGKGIELVRQKKQWLFFTQAAMAKSVWPMT
jgi:hypothetical protein